MALPDHTRSKSDPLLARVVSKAAHEVYLYAFTGGDLSVALQPRRARRRLAVMRPLLVGVGELDQVAVVVRSANEAKASG